ncbi:small subunit of acetolactate synthase-domain-containing protein [Polychytrium aggregatum]|uniref:small subunit of acetolactate synthase-domain-containing protein n=1 Tax=Polychytrium aggregatum TaxID=110093 RepID=UPI0022FE0ED2|nr:small subunit of acetolactate synthase-domain-containing protein [Polychytrium aggregatum]KAI9193708.1 small subunit of acetolactate synthase-domain-containing protein [Polychytrium aggregatum]
MLPVSRAVFGAVSQSPRQWAPRMASSLSQFGVPSQSMSTLSLSMKLRKRKKKYLFAPHPILGNPSAEEAVNNILYNTPSTAKAPVSRHVLNCLVTNEPGVLARVAGILAARNFNIDSLVVAKTDVPDLSRMTIVINGQSSVVEQARRQVEDLVPVWAVLDYTHARVVERELLLVKVSTVPHEHLADEDIDEASEVVHNQQENGPSTGLSPLLAASVQRQSIAELARLFNGRIVDISVDSVIAEVCASPQRIDAFVNLLKPYGIIEATRSGCMAMPRSQSDQDGETQEPEPDQGSKVDATMLPPG